MRFLGTSDVKQFVWVPIALALEGGINVASAHTIETLYYYNGDGALTAASTSIDQQPPTTTYDTYDNFTPDGGDPSTGTVHPADGNLLAIGRTPGAADSAAFAYDQRDRLITCGVGGDAAVSYAYHPNSLMASSTLSSGDVQQFYYGASPVVANTRQPSTGMVSSFLGPMRYLSDGTEQARLVPRKDTAALYQPADQTVTSYTYDPYGGSADQTSSASWNLAQNPFRYAAEYQDPVCGTYYLRARWYFPAQQVFLSRDPADRVHHYGYTGGNPIGRVDPSGMQFTYSDYQKGVNHFLHELTPLATALSVLPYVGPLMLLVQASAAGEFWHSANETEMFGFAALSAGVSAGLQLPVVDRVAGYRAAFALRNGAEVAIGGAQSAVAAWNHGRFEPIAFAENMAVTFGTIAGGRFVAGLGYRPFNLNAHGVEAMLQEHIQSGLADEALVFRERERLNSPSVRPWTTLWSDVRNAGLYHESIFALTKEGMFISELSPERLQNVNDEWTTIVARVRKGSPTLNWNVRGNFFSRALTVGVDDESEFNYVGKFKTARVSAAFETNRTGIPSREEQAAYLRSNAQPLANPYDFVHNNCQDHVAGILRALR